MTGRAGTVPEVLAIALRTHPDRELVVADDGSLTYADMARRVVGLGRRLAELGVGPGDRVGVLLGNGRRWIASYLSALTAGATAVPLNTWYRRDELLDAIERSHLRVLIAQREIAGHDFSADVDSILDELPAPGRPNVLWWEKSDELPADTVDATLEEAAATLAASPARPEHEGLLVFTSGSTAHPKAVRLVHGGLVRQGVAIGDRQGVVEGDRFWVASPLFFVFACANAIPNALTHGATLTVQERFDASEALAWIEKHHCTVYYGVGPMARALAASPDLGKRDISSLKKGTGNATIEDLRLIIEVLGVSDVCNAYGMTEGYGHSTITTWTDPPELRMRAHGTALPTQEVRVVDDDGRASPPNVVGHIQLRGTITPGYLDDDALDQASFTRDGWFRTGDLGELDEQGVLTYRGRSSETMKVNGINVSPAEVEALLLRHPDVDQAFVFSVPTARGEDAIVAVLVPHDGAAVDALPATVTAWAKERAAKYKIPTRYAVLPQEQIPLTATGKVSKKLLKESRRW